MAVTFGAFWKRKGKAELAKTRSYACEHCASFQVTKQQLREYVYDIGLIHALARGCMRVCACAETKSHNFFFFNVSKYDIE